MHAGDRRQDSSLIDDSCAPEGASIPVNRAGRPAFRYRVPVIEPDARLLNIAERFFDLPISKQQMAVAWLFGSIRAEISNGTLEPEADIIADIFEEALEAAL